MATADVPSSSSTPNSEKYDVFLSFRDKDTRWGFTSHLYAALHRKHIKTFKDDYGIKRGDEIKPEHLETIERSKIYIIIFSENYASSSRCLAELAYIIECHHKNYRKTIIPVFYDVEPSLIRIQKGSFGEAFVQHEQRFNNDMRVQEWRKAFNDATNLSGFESKSSQFRDEFELVERIAEDILGRLKDVPLIDGVFLSFHGKDTRKGFTSHLYAALLRKHIKTFKDDYDLKRGYEIKPELLEAIERSKISIVIFSENYASSSWCLAELAHILKCCKNDQKIVIPVFYDVDPSHMRNQQGSFKDAFVRHEQRFNNDTRVQDWREALCEAANLLGFHSTASEFRDESELVEAIVEDILRKLN